MSLKLEGNPCMSCEACKENLLCRSFILRLWLFAPAWTWALVLIQLVVTVNTCCFQLHTLKMVPASFVCVCSFQGESLGVSSLLMNRKSCLWALKGKKSIVQKCRYLVLQLHTNMLLFVLICHNWSLAVAIATFSNVHLFK